MIYGAFTKNASRRLRMTDPLCDSGRPRQIILCQPGTKKIISTENKHLSLFEISKKISKNLVTIQTKQIISTTKPFARKPQKCEQFVQF